MPDQFCRSVDSQHGRITVIRRAIVAALLAAACAPLIAIGAEIDVSLSPKDNVVWVSYVRRLGTDQLVVSYEDSLNGTGKHYLNIRAQSAKGRCDMTPGQAFALIVRAGEPPRGGTIVFSDTFGQHECRAAAITPFEA
jgi:hypothetical protein